MNRGRIIKTVLSGVLLGVGLVLPLLTSQIKEIGDTLLPMHIPVLLCGFLCGAPYGFLVGLVLPFFRSFLFGMPPAYPNALWMAAELAAYGFVSGFLYRRMKEKSIKNIYVALVSAMLSGRIVWGIAKAVLLGIGGKSFTLVMFLTGGFTDAVIGIVLQLILIPLCVAAVQKTSLKKQ